MFFRVCVESVGGKSSQIAARAAVAPLIRPIGHLQPASGAKEQAAASVAHREAPASIGPSPLWEEATDAAGAGHRVTAEVDTIKGSGG